MNSFKSVKSIISWLVFAIATFVYFLSAERTGSLWDCGEFILGAYKLQVVHPPGAPLFLLVGRMFTWVADLFSSNPEDIAFAVNMMSGICTAFTAFFVSRVTMLFGKRTFGSEDTDSNVNLLIGAMGLVAGLATAFTSSIWFSAVEGEVYAMSTMFTAMTFWAATRWYVSEDSPKSDRWILMVAFLAGLSIGVHLLSLLTLPAIGLMYYFKKYDNHSLWGAILGMIGGLAVIVFIQNVVIVGIPELWANFDLLLVNGMGLPFNSGLVLTLALVAGLLYTILKSTTATNSKLYFMISSALFVLMFLGWGLSAGNIVKLALVLAASYYITKNYTNSKRYAVQLFALASIFIMIGFSTIGVVVIRAQADTPINMNVPDDAMRLLPYLNREQYGERALVYGPHFDAKPKDLNREERYGKVGDKYEVVDEKLDYIYSKSDKIFLPRVGHTDMGRPQLHRKWYQYLYGKSYKGKNPSMAYNLKFMLNYQVGWMYWRYFFWNFVGKQNGTQGYFKWDKRTGHWMSGIPFIDEAKLYNMDEMTDTMISDPSMNTYYFIPLLIGLLGLFFMFRQRPKDFSVLLVLFLMTGLGIIIYSNQPPNEPRERDYVLVGSFFTFCIWIGFGARALYHYLSPYLKTQKVAALSIAALFALAAPLIMGFQNFDDHSRRGHYGSRDYASNFLESCEENAIIFTYGDNDTYPLWYAQEVENIRTDVRVVNLSLIAVDWYINKLRNKVNESAPLKLSLPHEAYRGNNRNQVFFRSRKTDPQQEVNLLEELRFIGNEKNKIQGQTVSRSRNLYLPVDLKRAAQVGMVAPKDSSAITNKLYFDFSTEDYMTKDELAIVDIIVNNFYDRPIYFAVTCKNEKLLGLNDHMQMEGLGLRLLPIKVKSDESLMIYGSGRVDSDKVFENVTEKWRWGNFDKLDTYINGSYGAELQAMKIVMMRAAEDLTKKRELDKAAELSKQFFSAFPHFNFPYDDSVTPFIRSLTESGQPEEAKKHIRILAEETYQNLNFYESLDESDFESGFQQDYGYAIRTVNSVLQEARRTRDESFISEMNNLLGDYDINKLKN